MLNNTGLAEIGFKELIIKSQRQLYFLLHIQTKKSLLVLTVFSCVEQVHEKPKVTI